MSTVGKPIKCRAAVVWKLKDPFVIETIEVAVPQKNEVRVRMTSTGVCHSDMHVKDGIGLPWPFPTVLGHEGAGFIESVGEGVTSVKTGDLVVLVLEGYCGTCAYCKDPRTGQCMKQPRDHFQRDGTSRMYCKGEKLSAMFTIGTFSEYTVVSENNVAKVNPNGDPKTLALLGCCVLTGFGAVENTARVQRGSTCAVWGLGGVGMCTVMACRESGASKIIGIDLNPQKFPLAKELGCTDVLNPKDVDDVSKKLAEMTNGGVEYCFVSVGIIAAMEQAFNSSHPAWGKTILIGISNAGETMRVGIFEMIYGRQLMGTYAGSYISKLAIPGLVEKVLKGEIQLEKVVSHRIPFNKINEGFKMLTTGESLRTIIDFDLKD